MDLYVFVYLLSNVFLAHIINKFMYLFYEKCRVNKYIEFCVYSAYFVLITFIFSYFSNPIITIIFNIFFIFIITFMYDYINFKKSMLVTFIVYLILFLIEVSVITLINSNKKSDIYLLNEYTNMLVVVIDSIIYICISFYICIKKFEFKKIDFIFSHKIFIFFIVVPLISISLILINFLFSRDIMYVILLNLILAILNIIIFKYCGLIIRNVHEIVFNKILKDKIDCYKKEIENFEGRINFKKHINSNNYVIDGILNAKIKDLDNEIKLKIDIFIEKNLNINLDDLLIVIGSLMDNAISGVKSTLINKHKYINIRIKYIKGVMIVNIKNSFNENTLYKRKKMFNKKNKFNNYGLGLLTVKEIVEKYKGILEIKFNKNNFETYILMYDIKV